MRAILEGDAAAGAASMRDHILIVRDKVEELVAQPEASPPGGGRRSGSSCEAESSCEDGGSATIVG